MPLTLDLKVDCLALGNGQFVTAVVSISSGLAALSSTTNLFISGDVGKAILVPGAGTSGGTLSTTITAFTDAKHVTLTANAATTVSAVSTLLFWATDDTAAFASFNSQALTYQSSNPGQLITLSIPAGAYAFAQTSFNVPLRGIKLGKAVGAGIDITTIVQTTQEQSYWAGFEAIVHKGLDSAGGGSARANTILPGATSATVQASTSFTVAQIAGRFTVGQCAIVAGFPVQGFLGVNTGYPPNSFFYEYVRITAVNTTTGLISFTPLATAAIVNTYKETWPHITDGANSGEADSGGGATLYACPDDWDVQIEISDFTNYNLDFQSVTLGRDITIRRMKFAGSSGWYPTQNYSVQVFDSTFVRSEIDKFVHSCTFDNCTLGLVDCQSPSPDVLTLQNGCTGGAGIITISGTPKVLRVTSGCVIDSILTGPTGRGRCDEIFLADSQINTITAGGMSTAATVDSQGVNNKWTMAAGVITIPNSLWNFVGPDDMQLRFAVPGTQCFWGIGGHFTILDATMDGTNCYVTTTWPGGFPMAAGAGALGIRVHPCPKFTCSNCTGTAGAHFSSFFPAGAPLLSVEQRTYPMGTGNPALAQMEVWGALKTIKYNVTHAYGGGALTFHLSEFDNWPYVTNVADGSTASYGGTADATVGGLTTVLRGALTGDAWFQGISNSGPQYSADISGTDPNVSITVTMNTDQGFSNQVGVAPLRLRLRA